MKYIVKMDTPSMGKGVLVTESWNEAVDDIKTKIEAGCRVIVEPVVSDHVHNFDRLLFGGGVSCTICDEVEPVPMSLFQLGPFTLPDGRTTHFKIECDVLTDNDWDALARLAVELLPPFGHIEGVPRGGIAFAKALAQYAYPSSSRLLIADDAWVTGLSMNRHRNNREALGVVAFARNEVDKWVVPLFRLDQRAEDVTYQLNRPPNTV